MSLESAALDFLIAFDEPPDDESQRMAAHLAEHCGEAVLAILLYGSRIHPPRDRAPSMLDFIVLVDDYDGLPTSRFRKRLCRILPPTVFYLEVPTPAGSSLRCKYNIVSATDLDAALAESMRDVYLAGRMSKRTRTMYVRDAAAAQQLANWRKTAAARLHGLALTLLTEEFRLEEYAAAYLGASYLGELRPAEPGKPRKLYEADQTYYDALFTALLSGERRTPRGYAGLVASDAAAIALRKRAVRLMRRSRRRGILRWPKHIATIDQWLTLLGEKTARSTGESFELNPTQRKRPWLFLIRQFLRLRKSGKLR